MLGVGYDDGNCDGKKDSATAPDGGNGFLRQKKRKNEDDLDKTLNKLKEMGQLNEQPVECFVVISAGLFPIIKHSSFFQAVAQVKSNHLSSLRSR
jgi:hypothetical protein